MSIDFSAFPRVFEIGTMGRCPMLRSYGGGSGAVRTLTSSSQPTRSPVDETNAEGVDGAASVDAQHAPTSRWENRTARGFPHRPQPVHVLG